MGLLDALKQYIGDAMPGGLLNSEVPKPSNVLSGLLSNAQPMPSIGGITSGIDNIKRTTARRLADLINNPRDYLAQTIAQTPQTIAEQGAGLAPMGLGAMTAWHASPYKFDKFDLSKIGTGEGAQAYGHGLYLAEARDVAQDGYLHLGRTKAGNVSKVGGVDIVDFYNKTQDIANSLPPAKAAPHYDRAAMLEDLMNNQIAPDVLARAKDNGYHPDAIKWFEKQVIPKYEPDAHLYKTDIPDEAVSRFLDWDKPLSQQAPEVQAAMEKAAKLKGVQLRGPWGELDTGIAYDRLAGTTGQYNRADATETLKKLGIPGIRYLDGGSRSAGQGSSNFVAFDPELIRILERNGVPTGQQPWKPGEWQGLL